MPRVRGRETCGFRNRHPVRDLFTLGLEQGAQLDLRELADAARTLAGDDRLTGDLEHDAGLTDPDTGPRPAVDETCTSGDQDRKPGQER